jgi:hypothetical protein
MVREHFGITRAQIESVFVCGNASDISREGQEHRFALIVQTCALGGGILEELLATVF